MKLTLSNNHIIVNIGGENYLIDTGLSCSFNFNGTRQITINSKVFVVSNHVFTTRENAERVVQAKIDGFIGLDILSKTNLTIDYNTNELLFSATDRLKNSIDFTMFNNCMLIKDFKINDKNIAMATLDIGAYQNVVSINHLLQNDKTNIAYRDYNPSLGDMLGYLYNAKLTVNGVDYAIKAEDIPQNACLRLCGFTAFINPKAFTKSRLVIDFNCNKIYYE